MPGPALVDSVYAGAGHPGLPHCHLLFPPGGLPPQTGMVWYGMVWYGNVWEVLQLLPRGRLEDLVARVEDNFLKLCTSQARNSHAWLASEIFSSMSRWAENGPKHANWVCVQKLWSLLHF